MFKPSILAGGSGEEGDDLDTYLLSVDHHERVESPRNDGKSRLLSAQRHPRLSKKLLSELKNGSCSSDSSDSATETETTSDNGSKLGLMANVRMADDLLKGSSLSEGSVSDTEGKPRLFTVEQLEEPDPSSYTTNTSVTEGKPHFFTVEQLEEPDSNSCTGSSSVAEGKPCFAMTKPICHTSSNSEPAKEEKPHFGLTVDHVEETEPSDHTLNTTTSPNGLGNVRMVGDLELSRSHTHSPSALHSGPASEAESAVSPASISEMEDTASTSQSLDSLHDQSSHTAGHYHYTDSFESDDEYSGEESPHVPKSGGALSSRTCTKHGLLADSPRGACETNDKATTLEQPDHSVEKGIDVGIQTDFVVDMDQHVYSLPCEPPTVEIEGSYSGSFFDQQRPLLPHTLRADALEGGN